jgi:hypothetical protein
MSTEISRLRSEYHAIIRDRIIRITPGGANSNGYPNFADGSSLTSINAAWGIYNRLRLSNTSIVDRISQQTRGSKFEDATRTFLEESFSLLHHLRPGRWRYDIKREISQFEQYRHLADLDRLLAQVNHLADSDPLLARVSSVKSMFQASQDYIIKPDIVIARLPVSDDDINQQATLVDTADPLVTHTMLRAHNNPRHPILHASISCKWTIRSDRTQNARTEALNLMRNRKGHLPHIVAVTAEPLPTRIASLALGTGDLDCVYHFALPELRDSLIELNNLDQLDILETMINGMRLRDISDLPFDLAV